MIEIETSDENVLKLFWFLNAEQRDNIRVNGTLLSEIKEKGLFIYLNNICFWTSLSFEESMLGWCKNDEIIIKDSEANILGYIQNIPNPEPKYYVFYRKTLLSVLKSWEDVYEFVNSLEGDARNHITISDDPERTVRLSWSGASKGHCWLEKYDDGTVIFRYKNTSASFWSSKTWNEVTVIDFMNNLKQVAKLKKGINEYCNIQDK